MKSSHLGSWLLLVLAAAATLLQPRALSAAHTIKVFEARLCDDAGNHCSTATRASLQSQLDIANQILVRSRLPFQFVIDPDTDLVGHTNNSEANNNCTLETKYTPGHEDCESCTDANGDGLKDGLPEDTDVTSICVPNDDWARSMAEVADGLQAANPDSIIVLSPGFAKGLKWDSEENEYVLKNKGGESSCTASYVQMPGSGGGGTLFAHEVGHYLCLPHTFGQPSPKSVAHAAELIEAFVESNNIDRHDHGTILGTLFDGDKTVSFDADNDSIADTFYVRDTPPDPAGSIYGKDAARHTLKCDPSIESVEVPVTYEDDETVTYAFRPDRRLVISYFKDCPSFDFLYSPNQAHIISAALFSHRFNLLRGELQGTVWVDRRYRGDERGTYYHPYDSLSEGLNATRPGKRLFVKKGTFTEKPTLSRPMVIESYWGSVVIGE